jgi:hypothetical protein
MHSFICANVISTGYSKLSIYDDDDHHHHINGRPPTGLLVILQAIYEHGELWWNDVDGGKLLIRPSQLSGNLTSRIIW